MANKRNRTGNASPDEKFTGLQMLVAPLLPLSLSMGAGVIFANACGDESVQQIVEGWRPKWRVTIVETLPEGGWQ